MKLPRWLIVSLLTASVVVTIATVARSWFVWPQATARLFAELTATAEIEEAMKLCTDFRVESCTVCHRVAVDKLPATDPPLNPANSLTLLFQLQQSKNTQLLSEPRSLSEVISGRQRFELSGARLLVVRSRVVRIDCQFAPK